LIRWSGCRVADGEGIERRGLVASETHGGLGDSVEGVDAVGREVPDEKMAVPVGGEAHGVERKLAGELGVGGVRLGLWLALRGGHMYLLPAMV